MADQVQRSAGHETRDINVRAVAWFAIGLVIAAVILHVSTAGLFVFFKREHPSSVAPSRITGENPLAPEPRLQTDDRVDMEKFRAAEGQKLNSYGWVDKDAGILHIPIKRAMDLIAQRGLPARTSPNDSGSGKTTIQMRQEKAEAAKP